MKILNTYVFLILLISCSNPFDGRGKLHFRDMKQEAREAAQNAQREREETQRQILAEKEKDWKEIISEANASFADISPIIERKCFDCHDANTRLPFYARVFPQINPLTKH